MEREQVGYQTSNFKDQIWRAQRELRTLKTSSETVLASYKAIETTADFLVKALAWYEEQLRRAYGEAAAARRGNARLIDAALRLSTAATTDPPDMVQFDDALRRMKLVTAAGTKESPEDEYDFKLGIEALVVLATSENWGARGREVTWKGGDERHPRDLARLVMRLFSGLDIDAPGFDQSWAKLVPAKLNDTKQLTEGRP